MATLTQYAASFNNAIPTGFTGQFTTPSTAVGSTEATTVTTTGVTQNADYGNHYFFDFSAIPAGATINSVTLEARHWASSAARGTFGYRIDSAPNTQIANEVTVTTVGTTSPAAGQPGTGGTFTTFSALPTVAQLQSANFGVRARFRRTASTADSAVFDWIRVTVNYTPGATTVSPTGFADTEDFGAPVAQLGAAATGFAETEAFGAPAAQLGVSPTGFADTEAFGAPAITLPPPLINVAPTGFADTETFGAPAIQLGITSTGFADSETFGNPAAQIGASPTGFADSEAFGALIVRLGVTGVGAFAETEAFGLPTIDPTGSLTNVSTIGFADTEGFGSPSIQLNVSGVGSEADGDVEAFGTLEVALLVVPVGFADAEAFGLFVASDASAPTPSLMLPNSGRNGAAINLVLASVRLVSTGKNYALQSSGKDTARVNR